MRSRLPEFAVSAGPLPGRLVLLAAAYAPVAVIAGVRATPRLAGWVSLISGALGVIVWIAFLVWLPQRQPRQATIERPEFIDAEVTGYIVSILLPIVAASEPTLQDLLAYGLCAALILLVAFAAGLWAVNPITYAFGIRAARATVDGKPQVILVRGGTVREGVMMVVRRLGVTLILEPPQP